MDQINTFYYHFPQYITSIALTFFIILVLNIIHNVAIQISKKKKKVQYNLKRRLIKATVYNFMSDSGHKGPKYLVYQTINGTTKPTKLYNTELAR